MTSKIYSLIYNMPSYQSNSSEFHSFMDRIKELEEKFCPEDTLSIALSSPDYDGDPTVIFDQDHLRAFRLLCHAETEAFLEAKAEDICKKEHSSWKSGGIPSDIVINLIATHYSGYNELDFSQKDFKPLTTKQLVNGDRGLTLDVTQKAISSYYHILKNNHGVKEKNFKNLFLPLGFTSNDYSEEWLRSLDSFGLLRGTSAHTSATTVQQPLNPSDEKTIIVDVIKGLQSLDIKIKERLQNQGQAMLRRIETMTALLQTIP
ncbi:HEPN domain-containing protein [Yersinia enterocolitica]|uniref:HEPN domain-containing protein n=1 Tax=Yersinia enterocolitica TaxID=630 RepID=UPI0028B7CAC4|nr:hypothetical protein [Yersinia enterocolitica]EKN4059464.1 hypothetical protein [Yersinia enterocolitica]EKN4771646.1 hypothetical protein [Yersinia enterocolitica]EKN6392044.1 hypothetical protein [Yersinia enterocolitica]ELI7900110.1 hypothetical protein [Yersinia enterocolitica]